jgi:hypothetical protein
MAQDKSSVMLLVAGFFGSLVAVGKANHASLRDNLLAISAGTSSAYFLGVLGMRGVEMLINKIFPEHKDGDNA